MRLTAQFIGGPQYHVRTTDFRNVWLDAPKEFVVRFPDGTVKKFRVPLDADSDLTSEPQLLWSLGMAPFGPEAPASVVHDSGYRGTLEVERGGQWVKANLCKDDCDDIYNALMFSLGVEDSRRLAIYEGVHLGGLKSFQQDRAP